MNEGWIKEKIGLLKDNRRVDDVALRVTTEDQNLTRFAENRIIQNVSKKINDVYITAFNDKARGVARTQDTKDESLLRTLKRAEEIALNSPADPEFIEPLDEREVKGIQRYFGRTKDITPGEKAEEINRIKKEAKSRRMEIAGQYSNGEYFVGYANSRGHIAFHCYTNVSFSLTAMLDDSSGYASETDENIDKVDPGRVADVAFSKAILGKDPVGLKAGEYVVILEPQAVADFIPFLAWSMDRRASDEGYVYFSGRLNKKIASPKINLYSDPYCIDNPSEPFVSENGLPLEKVYWIENGILKNLHTSRYWANKKNLKPIGFPTNVILGGGKKSTAEIIKESDDALLVTRLWYIRFVNRKDLMLTGMTRDGLYRVKNGKIVTSFKNMRFNDSPIRLLDSVLELGLPKRIEGHALIPPIVAQGFKLASETLF
jgi:predicted Zn-dependent protease